MAIDFTLKDVLHKVTAKLTPAYLPDAACPFGTRKPYNLRAALQTELDIHGVAIKAEAVAVNEPRTLKVVVPITLNADGEYYLKIVTQSSARHGAAVLKNTRETWTDFVLTTQNPRT